MGTRVEEAALGVTTGRWWAAILRGMPSTLGAYDPPPPKKNSRDETSLDR